VKPAQSILGVSCVTIQSNRIGWYGIWPAGHMHS